jgi:hypothetical protein
MNKYEERRLSLLRLVEQMGRGGRVRVSNAINKSPDYIARMLYPKDKPGHKGIGEDTVDLLDKAFPDWRNKDTSVESAAVRIHAAKEPGPPAYTQEEWPFKTIRPADWRSLPLEQRDLLELQIRALLPLVEANSKAA